MVGTRESATSDGNFANRQAFPSPIYKGRVKWRWELSSAKQIHAGIRTGSPTFSHVHPGSLARLSKRRSGSHIGSCDEADVLRHSRCASKEALGSGAGAVTGDTGRVSTTREVQHRRDAKRPCLSADGRQSVFIFNRLSVVDVRFACT
jgi:hypothetical protein